MTIETTYQLVVEHDPDVSPEEFDCYDAVDVERFKSGQWVYVYAYPLVTIHDGRTGITTTYRGGGVGGIDWAWDAKSVAYLRELMQDDIDVLASETGLSLPPVSEWEIKQ